MSNFLFSYVCRSSKYLLCPFALYYVPNRSMPNFQISRIFLVSETLKVHKNENFFGSDFEFCTISFFHKILLFMQN